MLQSRQSKWPFLASWQWMNKADLHHPSPGLGIASPFPITAQTTAASESSPSISCKQHSFPQIPALGPAQAAVSDHSSQFNMLFGLNFLKTRNNSGAVSNELPNVWVRNPNIYPTCISPQYCKLNQILLIEKFFECRIRGGDILQLFLGGKM